MRTFRSLDPGDLTSIRVAGGLLTMACHSASYNAGWWRDANLAGEDCDLARLVRSGTGLLSKALVAQKLCLIHSEISEAMEGHRKGKMDEHLPHRTSIEVELADAVIRIADLAGALGLDLGGAIAEKMAYNAIRPDHKPAARAAAGGKSY